MSDVSRRGVMKGGAGVLALSAFTPGAALATEAGTALFVFDARLALSQTAALDMAAAGADLLDPRASDLGVAWRGQIPAVMANGGAVAGLTLWSDCLISQIFARERGLDFAFAEVAQDAAGLPLYHWRVG